MLYKVLVVDDESAVKDLFCDLLLEEDCQVKSASTGEEAMEMVSKEDFDVVLLDIKLPGISGLEVLKRVKESKPAITVIMITGFGYDETLIAKSREYGSSGYIGKNMPIAQIINSFKDFARVAREKRNNDA